MYGDDVQHSNHLQQINVENLPEPINQEEAMVTGGDQDLQVNSETSRERANRLQRERRASLSAAKKDAAAQLRHDQDLQENSETPRDRANRLRRERRVSLSAAKKDAAAQLRHDHGSLRQEERDENLPEPINQEEDWR